MGNVMDRRAFLMSSAAAVLAPALLNPALSRPAWAQTAAPPAFGFEDVARRAAELARDAYAAPPGKLTGGFADLGYDQYRGIRFRRDADPWAEAGPFALDLLPPGMLFKNAVAINLVQDGLVTPVPFDPMVFDYDPNGFPKGIDTTDLGQMGWSGFRLRFPLNRPGVMDEVVVFQGASYFRAVSRGTLYGQSARGLALGTGSADGEEFPLFREFWLHRPGPQDRAVRIHALLDSPSVAGAYEFLIAPGEDTVISTRLALFPRRELADVGIAPLTSMYWFGPADRAGIDDFRTAVHDSDGLQMTTGTDQRLWRVLSSHGTLQLSAFVDENPRGFGLAQRARDFDEFQDAEARYDLRPSAWVAPRGSWGKGQVTLVEIPVQNEFNDNIVVFWRPEKPLPAGERRDFAYDLTFAALPPDDVPLARVVRTLSGRSVNGKSARTYVIDFDLRPFGADDPTPQVTASAGKITSAHLQRLPAEGVMRLSFDFVPEGETLAELSAALNGPAGALTETWLSRWTRD